MIANPDFIEVYPGALDARACADAIAYFERCGQATRGATGSGVDLALKDSWDVVISGRADWQAHHDAVQGAAFRGLLEYVRKYRYALIAPLALKVQDPATGSLRALDAEAVGAMDEATLSGVVQLAFRPGTINVQKYLADQGGYPYWHCEHYPKAGSVDPLHRVLLYTIYLNDGFGAGETEFLYQQRKIAPRAGDLLIAPAFFTHTHRGNRPTGRDKYIATSWVLFQTAEALFGKKG
ncbi:MAG TPA: 2OG-Fe(II) oxygenase [Xanthomonadales bacterium]|nr:2OG-Fe(II) oxygenase [Xanthomonadales bacterium]